MNATTNLKRCLAVSALLLIVALLVAAAPGFARMRTAILCDAGETNCVEAWEGASITLYSDQGTTQKWAVNGASGNMTVGGATTLAAALNKITASSTITATDGNPITATATINTLTAAGEVTPTLAIPLAGVYACFYNTSANAILIQDTGNQVLAGNATLGQYDTLCIWSDGTRVIEISRSNN